MTVQIKKDESMKNISMTSLIDMVFLLLIFFLVSTRFDEEERLLDIHLPEASEAAPLIASPRELIVNINREGRYFIYGQEYPLEGLRTVLEGAWDTNPTGASVIIRGDRRCPFGRVVSAANLCKHLGIPYSAMTVEE